MYSKKRVEGDGYAAPLLGNSGVCSGFVRGAASHLQKPAASSMRQSLGMADGCTEEERRNAQMYMYVYTLILTYITS